MIPAGDAAKGYTTMTFNTPGNYPVLEEIRKKVYGAGKGNLDDKTRVGSVYHMRGVTAAILWRRSDPHGAGEIRQGQGHDRRAVRWGLENLNVDEARPEGARRAPACSRRSRPRATTTRARARSRSSMGRQEVEAITPNWVVGDKALTASRW